MMQFGNNRIFSFAGGFSIWLLVFFFSGGSVADAGQRQVLKAEEIEAQAMQFLSERLPWDPDSTDVSLDFDRKDLDLPAGRLELDFRLPASTVRAGRVPFSAQVKVDNKFFKRLRLNARILLSLQRIKTTRAVNRGEILSEDDVEMETIQSSRVPRQAVTRLEDVVGFEVVRNLGAGRVILMNALRKPPLVDKGDQVILVAEKGSMRITVPGIVRQKGFKGGLVQVLNVQTKKVVFGHVVDAQTIKVIF